MKDSETSPPKRGKLKATLAAPNRERSDLSRTIGSMLRAARQVQGLSQEQLAELTTGSTGLSRTMISVIENGRSLPGLQSLAALAGVLHIDPAEVFELCQVAGEPPVASECSLDELGERAERHFWTGDYRSALATYDAMLERLAVSPPKSESERSRSRARIEVNRAVTLRRCGALSTAQASAQLALTLTEGFTALQAEAYVILAAILVERGCLPLARDAAVRAVTLSRSAGAAVKSRAHNQHGDALHASGSFREALAEFEIAKEHAIEAGDHHHRAKTEGNIGACLLALGQAQEAESRFLEAVRLARKHGDPQSESRWLVELARLAFDRGQLAEADRLAAGAARIAKPRQLIATTFRAEWLRHEVARKLRPGAPDRQRLALLKRLLQRLKQHWQLDEVRAFREQMEKDPQA